jgi:hypothetical protein
MVGKRCDRYRYSVSSLFGTYRPFGQFNPVHRDSDSISDYMMFVIRHTNSKLGRITGEKTSVKLVTSTPFVDR